MDGRWSLRLVGGLLGGLLGCTGLQNRPAADTQVAKAAKSATPPPALMASAAPKLKPSTHVSMGTVAEQVAEDPERSPQEREAARRQARESYQKAIDLDAKYVSAHAALARSYALTGERDRAQAAFKKAQALAPKDARIVFEQGTSLARAKEWEAAVECMSKAVQMEPDNQQYQKYLGLTLCRVGRYDDGLAALAQCMPEPEARYTLARMLKHNQQGSAAEQQLRLALKADPNFEPARMLLGETDSGPDSGIRTVGYEEPARVAPAPPAAATAPRLLPVMLGGGSNLAPAPPTGGGSE